MCVLNSRVNSPDGKDTTIGESRAGRGEGKHVWKLELPTAQENAADSGALADANPGRQRSRGLGTLHCINSSHELSLTRPGHLDVMSELGRDKLGGRRIGFLGHHLSPPCPG